MWRYLTNCLRESLQRGVGHVDARCGAQGAQGATNPNRGNHPNNGSCRPTGNSRIPPNSHWYNHHLCESWINAFTWSGALVLGWYASQLGCLCKRFTLEDSVKYYYNYFINAKKESIQPFASYRPIYSSIKSEYQESLYFNQPNSIPIFFPTNVSNDILTKSGTIHNDENEFKEVLRSIENKLGITAINEGNTKDGVALLYSSVEKDYTPAFFNLGLCYEKGLGVIKDENMAMKLYRAAASRSHPDAMYNLAIFYGQGRGGLKRDHVMAEDLLRLAAAKGQKNAIAVLKILENNNEENFNVPNFKNHLSEVVSSSPSLFLMSDLKGSQPSTIMLF